MHDNEKVQSRIPAFASLDEEAAFWDEFKPVSLRASPLAQRRKGQGKVRHGDPRPDSITKGAGTFRASLSVAKDGSANISSQRASDAPLDVAIKVFETLTLFDLGIRLRDGLRIPERGFGLKLGYVAYLEAPDQQKSSTTLLSIQPEYAASPAPSYFPFMARAGNAVLWGHALMASYGGYDARTVASAGDDEGGWSRLWS